MQRLTSTFMASKIDSAYRNERICLPIALIRPHKASPTHTHTHTHTHPPQTHPPPFPPLPCGGPCMHASCHARAHDLANACMTSCSSLVEQIGHLFHLNSRTMSWSRGLDSSWTSPIIGFVCIQNSRMVKCSNAQKRIVTAQQPTRDAVLVLMVTTSLADLKIMGAGHYTPPVTRLSMNSAHLPRMPHHSGTSPEYPLLWGSTPNGADR